MGGFWAGFSQRAGERAHEDNMLDIQQKVEKHKSFLDHMQKIVNDPTYLPEAQEAAHRKWVEASQAGPMKFKKYDIDDILTIKTPKLTSSPGPPEQDGGPADVTKPQFYSPTRLPGEPEVSRSGRWDPFEQGGIAAAGYGMKQEAGAESTFDYKKGLMKAPSESDPVLYRNPILGRTLKANGISQINGVPINDDERYLEIRQRSGKITYSSERAPEYQQGYIGQGGVPTLFNKSAGSYDSADMNPGTPLAQVPTFPIMRYEAPTKQWYANRVDAQMQLTGQWAPIPPPANIIPTSTSTEHWTQIGNSWVKTELGSTRTPGVSAIPTTPQVPGVQPSTPNTSSVPLPIAGPPAPPIPPPPGAEVVQPIPQQTLSKPVRTRSGAASIAKAKASPTAVATPSPAALAAQAPPQPIPDPQWDPEDKNLQKALEQPEFNPNFRPQPNLMVDPATGGVMLSTTSEATSLQEQLRTAGDARTAMGGKQLFINQRSLTGQQVLQASANRRVFDTTAGLLAELLTTENLKTLSSLFNQAKLKIASDPSDSSQFIVNVLSKLDPTEEKLKRKLDRIAASRISLQEHVQTIRTPLGAAGFRSLEAFLALQSQAGNLIARPEIARHVLQNTLKTVLALRSVYDYAIYYNLALQGRYQPMTPTAETLNAFRVAYNDSGADTVDDWESAKTAMRDFGYSPKTAKK